VTFQRNVPWRRTCGSSVLAPPIIHQHSITDKLDSMVKRGTQRRPLVTELIQLLGHKSQSVFWSELCKIFRVCNRGIKKICFWTVKYVVVGVSVVVTYGLWL